MRVENVRNGASAQRPSRWGIVALVGAVVLTFLVSPAPASAHNASRSKTWGPANQCTWKGTQDYVGWPNLIAVATTSEVSGCGNTRTKLKWLDGNVWRLSSATGHPSSSVLRQPANHVSYPDHNAIDDWGIQWFGARLWH